MATKCKHCAKTARTRGCCMNCYMRGKRFMETKHATDDEMVAMGYFSARSTRAGDDLFPDLTAKLRRIRSKAAKAATSKVQ